MDNNVACYARVATEEQMAGAKKRKRAVAYVRVSSGSDAQLHSFEFQSAYWHQELDGNPDVEMVGIYADKGISGRSMYKRPQFLTMMQDARDGKFDVIYTKSISRFGRNTVHLLEAVRELRDLGIAVIFQNENINTLSSTSEVFMTIAAALAESELEEDSKRQRWSYQDRFQNGWISIGAGMYGYRMVEGNQLEIIEEEATVVREIFSMYLSGMGATAISNVLNERGIKTSRGNPWCINTILEIISNEKYTGDSLMGKHVRINGVFKENTGGRYSTQYMVENTHEGIVTHEVFKKAQEERARRQNPKLLGVQHDAHDFTGLIECGVCGMSFNHKINSSGLKWANPIWACRNQLRNTKKACDNTRIKEDVLREKFVEAYNRFVIERPCGNSLRAMEKRVKTLREEERDLAGLALRHLIPDAAFRAEQKKLKAELAELTAAICEQTSKEVTEADYTVLEAYDSNKVKKFITKVIVLKGTVTFVFYNGVEITLEYSNGAPGNKPGWKNTKEV